MKSRPGIHGLLSVSMLIGFSLVMAALFLTFASDDTNTSDCVISEVSLYSTSSSNAYFVISLQNLGSGTITSLVANFVDNDGVMHGFMQDVNIRQGQMWKDMGAFSASVSEDNAIFATVTYDDGSMVHCIR